MVTVVTWEVENHYGAFVHVVVEDQIADVAVYARDAKYGIMMYNEVFCKY